jgi:hypothetical protein
MATTIVTLPAAAHGKQRSNAGDRETDNQDDNR